MKVIPEIRVVVNTKCFTKFLTVSVPDEGYSRDVS